MSTVQAPRPLSAEDFRNRPDPGRPEELVRGNVETTPPTNRRHGKVCNLVGRLLGNFVEDHDLGHVLNNDAGLITTRNPDTVRGPDVAFYSYARLPKGPVPDDYGSQPPELVVEVRSPSDRWRDIHEKVTEYLQAGVLLVLVLDPEPSMAYLFSANDAPRMLGPDDELTFPGLLEGFRVPVGRVFE